jgi:hypothetical protein
MSSARPIVATTLVLLCVAFASQLLLGCKARVTKAGFWTFLLSPGPGNP